MPIILNLVSHFKLLTVKNKRVGITIIRKSTAIAAKYRFKLFVRITRPSLFFNEAFAAV